jgi:hypothetical protein
MRRREYYADLYKRCDALEARCEALAAKDAAKKAAHAALMAAEAAFTAPEDDCAWIPERSATRLRKAHLNVLSKLGNQGLEEPGGSRGHVGRDDWRKASTLTLKLSSSNIALARRRILG